MSILSKRKTTLSWVKCTGSVWCTLKRVNLVSAKTAHGVYVIFKPSGMVVRVGQGNVAERLEDHRGNSEIMQYGDDLLVTWAQVDQALCDGVERYLELKCHPIVGERFPQAQPIEVNLPF